MRILYMYGQSPLPTMLLLMQRVPMGTVLYQHCQNQHTRLKWAEASTNVATIVTKASNGQSHLPTFSILHGLAHCSRQLQKAAL